MVRLRSSPFSLHMPPIGRNYTMRLLSPSSSPPVARSLTTPFMIASKVICDDNYSSEPWTIAVEGISSLREANEMESERFSTLPEWPWSTTFASKGFKAWARHDVASAQGPSLHILSILRHRSPNQVIRRALYPFSPPGAAILRLPLRSHHPTTSQEDESVSYADSSRKIQLLSVFSSSLRVVNHLDGSKRLVGQDTRRRQTDGCASLRASKATHSTPPKPKMVSVASPTS